MSLQKHDRVNVYNGDWDDSGEIVGFTEGGYQVLVDGEEDLGPQEFDAARVERETISVVFTEAGDEIRVGTWVVAEYVNTPSVEMVRVAGEVEFIDIEDGQARLTLMLGPSGFPERIVSLDEVVDTGNDAE